MRDTIIGILVFLSVVGGYFAFRSKTEPAVSSQPQPSNALLAHIQTNPSPIRKSSPKISKRLTKITRKAINHERTQHRKSRAFQDDGHHQGSSGTFDEAEKLPSIYEDQEGRFSELNTSESPKSVYGVPVDSWVLSRRNSIVTEPADPKLAEGVRVFVGCVELKKEGAKELTKRDCAKIAATTQSIR